jgi:hypothetical protein
MRNRLVVNKKNSAVSSLAKARRDDVSLLSLKEVEQAIADKQEARLTRLDAMNAVVLKMSRLPRSKESIASLLAEAKRKRDLLATTRRSHYSNEQLARDSIDHVVEQQHILNERQRASSFPVATENQSSASHSATTQAEHENLASDIGTRALSFAFWAINKGVSLLPQTEIWQSGVPSLFENQLPKQAISLKKLRF